MKYFNQTFRYILRQYLMLYREQWLSGEVQMAGFELQVFIIMMYRYFYGIKSTGHVFYYYIGHNLMYAFLKTVRTLRPW